MTLIPQWVCVNFRIRGSRVWSQFDISFSGFLQLQMNRPRSRTASTAGTLLSFSCEQKRVQLQLSPLGFWMFAFRTVRQSCWPQRWPTLAPSWKMSSVSTVSPWGYTCTTSPSLSRQAISVLMMSSTEPLWPSTNSNKWVLYVCFSFFVLGWRPQNLPHSSTTCSS